MKRLLSAAILLTLGLLQGSAYAQNLTAAEVVDRLRDRFDESGVFSATFTQTVDDNFGGSAGGTVLTGTIIAGNEGYRIEMPDQTIVTDETTTWVYLKQDEQVIINDFIEDEASFSPNMFIGDGATAFDAAYSTIEDARHFVLELTPRSFDSYVETATLWVSKTDYGVSRIVVVDVNGASIDFEMSDLDFRPVVTDDTFRFVIPSNVEVIDLRS